MEGLLTGSSITEGVVGGGGAHFTCHIKDMNDSELFFKLLRMF